MGMRFFGGGVGHKSTRAATDHFLDDRDHADLDIDGQDDPTDNLMDWHDEADDEHVVEGSILDSDDNYGYGDPFDELEDIASDDSEDDGNSEEGGASVDGS
jgi:hypothetical protein